MYLSHWQLELPLSRQVLRCLFEHLAFEKAFQVAGGADIRALLSEPKPTMEAVAKARRKLMQSIHGYAAQCVGSACLRSILAVHAT